MYDENYNSSNNDNIGRLLSRFEAQINGRKNHYFESDSMEQIIDAYLEQNKNAKALAAVNFAIEQFPYILEFLVSKSDILILVEQYDEALELLNHVISMGMDDANIHTFMGEAYMMKGMFKESVQSFKIALDKCYDEAEKENIYLEISYVFQELNRFDKSIYYLRKALNIDPKNEDAITEMGLCIEMNGDYDLGVEIFQEIIDAHPYCTLAWFYLGLSYSENGLYEKALEAFEYTFIIDESYMDGYMEYANTLVKMKDFEEALKVYQKVIADAGPGEDVLKEIGNVHLLKGEYEFARTSFEKAIKYTFGEEFTDELWYMIGLTYEAEESYIKAKRCYELAFEKYNDSKYMLAIASVESELGDVEQAYEDFENAIELDPYNETGWLGYANCLFENEEFKSAQEKIESSLLMLPDNAKLRYLLSGCMFRNGNYKQAQFELEKALSLDFKNYNQIFESFPDLEKNNQVMNVIEQYRNKL